MLASVADAGDTVGMGGGGVGGWDVQSGILAWGKSRNSSHCTRSHAIEHWPGSQQPATTGGHKRRLVSGQLRAEHCPPAFLLSAPTPALQDPCWALGVMGLTPNLTMVGSMGKGSRAVRPCLGGGGVPGLVGKPLYPSHGLTTTAMTVVMVPLVYTMSLICR